MAETRQPRPRPESMAARNFSEDLDSLFGLNSGTTLGNLSFTVQEKKRNVLTQEEELAAIEARLRETEERLARAAVNPDEPSNGIPSPPQQATAGGQTSFPPRHSSNPQSYAARPPNAREESFQPHIPGAMPTTPTPGQGSDNDYVTVDRTR